MVLESTSIRKLCKPSGPFFWRKFSDIRKKQRHMRPENPSAAQKPMNWRLSKAIPRGGKVNLSRFSGVDVFGNHPLCWALLESPLGRLTNVQITTADFSQFSHRDFSEANAR